MFGVSFISAGAMQAHAGSEYGCRGIDTLKPYPVPSYPSAPHRGPEVLLQDPFTFTHAHATYVRIEPGPVAGCVGALFVRRPRGRSSKAAWTSYGLEPNQNIHKYP